MCQMTEDAQYREVRVRGTIVKALIMEDCVPPMYTQGEEISQVIE